MGKWAARLAEFSAAPAEQALTKLPKGGGEGLLSVLAVPFRGDPPEFQQPLADPDPDPDPPAEAPPPHSAATLARLQQFQRRGFDLVASEAMALRLVQRDADQDRRALCLECAHLAGSKLAGWRCGRPRAADVAAQLPTDMVAQLANCPAFQCAPWCASL